MLLSAAYSSAVLCSPLWSMFVLNKMDSISKNTPQASKKSRLEEDHSKRSKYERGLFLSKMVCKRVRPG